MSCLRFDSSQKQHVLILSLPAKPQVSVTNHLATLISQQTSCLYKYVFFFFSLT